MTGEVNIVRLPLGRLQLPEEGLADLWLARPDELPVQAGPMDETPTGNAGDSRKEKLARLRLRQQFLLRLLLGAYMNIPGKDVRLVRSGTGKPVLIPAQAATGLRFSLSHSGDWLMIGIARNHVIGVDIEAHRTMPRARELARRFFHPVESSDLEKREEPDLSRDFLATWTAKEAMVKAAGTGLAGYMDQIVTAPGAPGRLVRVPEDWPDPIHWSLMSLDLPEPLAAHVAMLHPSARWRLNQLQGPGRK